MPLVLVIFWFFFLVPYIGQWLTGAERPIQVGAFQSWMSTGSSHHFITYQSTATGVPDGTLQQCQGVAGKWVYATSVSGQVIELKMPDGVGLSMNATIDTARQ